MKNSIKPFVKRHYFLLRICNMLVKPFIRIKNMRGVKVENKSVGSFVIDNVGTANSIYASEGSFFDKTRIHICGNNNHIKFGPRCIVGENCSFWMEGDNISIIIGAKTTFTHTVHFCAQENDMSITVGEDCMFSNSIIVRTSDSHPIYDISTHSRINPPKSVVVGSHVWIAPNSKIMKGADIGDGAIIGSNTIVTKPVPANTLVVGAPAKVVKEDVMWTREKLF